MKVKTYGVPDLTEWHGKLKAGSLEVAVSFTGGTASPSGAQPAYFMTKDPIVQFVIENSKEFKNGFIILVMSQEIAGKHPRMAVPKPAPVVESPAASPHTPSVETPSETEHPTGEAEDKPTPEDADDTDGADDADGANDTEGAEGADDGDGKVEVPDKMEAIEYLKEHFPEKGYTATKLRTQTAFQSACAECGVEFVFTA